MKQIQTIHVSSAVVGVALRRQARLLGSANLSNRHFNG